MLCLSVGQHLSFHISSRGWGLGLKLWREGHWFYSWGWRMGMVVTTVACILIEGGQWRGLQWFYLILIIRDLVYTEIKGKITWSKHILTLCRTTPLLRDFKERNVSCKIDSSYTCTFSGKFYVNLETPLIYILKRRLDSLFSCIWLLLFDQWFDELTIRCIMDRDFGHL